MDKPLRGVRVLAVEQYGAGPFGTQHLADLGAEVVKVENRNTGGDYARGLGPFFAGKPDAPFPGGVEGGNLGQLLQLFG